MLKRIYSDTNLIKEIKFHSGINIILGKYNKDRETSGVNGIGKSSLIRLIDFLLLSKKTEKIFSEPKYNFFRKKEHTITLELDINQNVYYIKRYFKDLNKICFGNDANNLLEYDKSEMHKVLENIFFPINNSNVFIKGNRFGTLMEFYVKDDIQNIQRMDPLNFVSYKANERDKSLYNFYLLNLPTKNIVSFNDNSKEHEDKSKMVLELKKKIKDDTGKSLEEFNNEKIIIEEKIKIIEKNLKDFNFLDSHKYIEKDLSDIIRQINEQSNLYHSSSRKLEKLISSYKDVIEIDVNRIEKLYNDTKSEFGNFVKKKLDNIIEFKSQLLINRRKFLIDEETKLKETIDNTLINLEKLEKKRSQLFSNIKEIGSFDKIKNSYNELIEEKIKLERNNAIIKEIDEFNSKLKLLEIDISKLKNEIFNDIKSEEIKIKELMKLFRNILENAIFLNEQFDKFYFEISNYNSKLITNLPFSIKINIPKEGALGHEKLKLVAYDLMVFLNSRLEKRETPDFLIHDGVYHSIAKKTVINVLNYMYNKYNELQNFQYILTFNEDEIDFSDEINNKYGELNFKISDFIIASFSDSKENTLFNEIF